MPYDNETGHSYFKSDKDAEHWLSYYVPEAYYYTSPIDQQGGTIPTDTSMCDDSPFIPEDPFSMTTLSSHDAGASVYKEGDVTGSTSKG